MKAQNFKQEKEIMYFKENIKDTFEDELADTVIRILDLCGARGIDLEKHIYLKLKYKATRERMHGKNY
jgi:NTP pyrophosphatase (non-canonical NTP hydrolase)